MLPISVNAVLPIEELPAKCQVMSAHPPRFKLSSFPRSVRQELAPPSRVTPINACKLQHELCLHPTQALVDYVISALSFGFRLWFQPRVRFLKIGKSKDAYRVFSAFRNWPLSHHRTWERSCCYPLLNLSFITPSHQSLWNNSEEILARQMAAYFGLV